MSAMEHNVAGLVALCYAALGFAIARAGEGELPSWAIKAALLVALLNFGAFVLRTSYAGWLVLFVGGAR